MVFRLRNDGGRQTAEKQHYERALHKNRVEAELKDFTTYRIPAIDKLSLEGEFNSFPRQSVRVQAQNRRSCEPRATQR